MLSVPPGSGLCPFLLQSLYASCSPTQPHHPSLNRWLCLLPQMADSPAQRSFPPTSAHARAFHPSILGFSLLLYSSSSPSFSLPLPLSVQVSLNQPHRVPSKIAWFSLDWFRAHPIILEHPSSQRLNCNCLVSCWGLVQLTAHNCALRVFAGVGTQYHSYKWISKSQRSPWLSLKINLLLKLFVSLDELQKWLELA